MKHLSSALLISVLTLAACGAADNPALDTEADAGAGADGAASGGQPLSGGSPAPGGEAPSGGAAPGGEAPSGGAPSMGGQPASGGAAPVDPCEAACARVAECVTEVCPAQAGAQRAEVEQACRFECAANPSFPIVVGGIDTCADVVAFGRQAVGEPLPTLCPEGTGPAGHYPVCDVFGERAATCIAEVCAPVESLREVVIAAYTRFCDDAANRGEFNPDDVAALITPQTDCSFPILADIVRSSTEPGSDLANVCANGPVVPQDVCVAACAVLSPCIPPDADAAALADPALCGYVCGVNADVDARIWACAADLESGAACDVALGCFNPGPPPARPECDAYAARVAACTAEACAPIADVLDGFAGSVASYCAETIADNPDAAAFFSMVGADTPCDDAAVSGIVNALLVDDPANDGDGALVDYCANGPVNEVDTVCTSACEVLVPCLPEQGDAATLRAPGACVYYCSVGPAEVPSAAWACMVNAGSCEAAFACVMR